MEFFSVSIISDEVKLTHCSNLHLFAKLSYFFMRFLKITTKKSEQRYHAFKLSFQFIQAPLRLNIACFGDSI